MAQSITWVSCPAVSAARHLTVLLKDESITAGNVRLRNVRHSQYTSLKKTDNALQLNCLSSRFTLMGLAGTRVSETGNRRVLSDGGVGREGTVIMLLKGERKREEGGGWTQALGGERKKRQQQADSSCMDRMMRAKLMSRHHSLDSKRHKPARADDSKGWSWMNRCIMARVQSGWSAGASWPAFLMTTYKA